MLRDVLEHEGFTGAAIATRILARLDRPRGNVVGPNAHDPRIERSQALWTRARTLIPAGTQTLAKGPGQHVDGVAPKYASRGRGGRIWDVDGNEFVDLTMGVGPLVLGYGDPEVDDAIARQLQDGITFSLMHPLEVEVAELIRDVVPGAQSVRFSKTGADVTSAAVRLARAFTGRERVICCGYHGWHDWYIGTTDRHRGIPSASQDLVSTFAYNDLASLREALDDDTACVILEPQVVLAPAPGFLAGVRQLCDERGALLVFDEMWTGFRMALGGAQQAFGVTADLACFSKAIANGMPLSALTGRADVMQLLDKDVFFFTTFGGEALSLAAAAATIPALRQRRVPELLAARGQALKAGFAEITHHLGLDWTRLAGLDVRPQLQLDARVGDPLLMKSFLQQELVRRGILWSGFVNLCAAHRDEDLVYVLDACREILPALARAIERGTLRDELRGAPVEPVFRKTTAFHTRPRRNP
ncbi:MAG: aminotransferase class III-fold pyridoxal phosphate-dependent enzyme [Deltaproteobacteria bacterium]|nr:aminotransferase class III-fold pyridoxal phosphate-dependent enzyme [Deltaproteobacteria bacterium]